MQKNILALWVGSVILALAVNILINTIFPYQSLNKALPISAMANMKHLQSTSLFAHLIDIIKQGIQNVLLYNTMHLLSNF